MSERRYSLDGPVCPYCGNQETPDEAFYYDPATTELECGVCDKTYQVEIDVSTSWATTPMQEQSQ